MIQKTAILFLIILGQSHLVFAKDHNYNQSLEIEWKEIVQQFQNNDNTDKLNAINHHFNKTIKFKSDISHWGEEDYWATPLESLSTQQGDCEDYVISKYFSLIQSGIPKDNLRIIYAKSLRLKQAHMVLGYYEHDNSDPLILDNIIKHVVPASSRPDLDFIYSFNDQGMWIIKDNKSSILMGDPQKLEKWTNLLNRMNTEGFF
jgi:predicted transglutaminase-like cysteine proteinase